MGLTLIGATCVGAVFALVNYNLAMLKVSGGATAAADDEEEDI